MDRATADNLLDLIEAYGDLTANVTRLIFEQAGEHATETARRAANAKLREIRQAVNEQTEPVLF